VAICSLLGIPAAVVALTKTDLVSADLLELAQLEVEELLQETPFVGAPIAPVSAVSGDGLPRLRELLIERAGAVAVAADASRPARLPIDRAFHLKGLGVVVTGTLAAGRVAPGDELAVVPGERTARVRSVQVHGAAREEALAGERTSLQLAGIELGELERGQQLAPAGALATTHRMLARCTWLPDAGKPLAGWTPVRVHLLAAETLGKARALAPPELVSGGTGVVELRLDRPLAAVRGDRLVLRRPSPQATLGGGEVLDPLWRRRRGRQRDEAVTALAGGLREALRLWVEEAGEGGASAEDLARRLGVGADLVRPELSALAGEQRLLKVPAPGAAPAGGDVRWLAPAVVQRVTARAKRVLKEYFQRERLADGMPRAEAVRRILRGRGGELADRYFEWLAAQRVLAVAGDRINLPGRRAELSGDESRLATQVLAAYEAAGLTPPSPGELAKGLNAKQQIFDGVVRYLRQQGRLAQLPGGLLVSRDALDKLVAALRGTGWERFSVPQFKERFELSRKWAIPLLEHLDSIAVTRRVGDDRQLVR
jgi:selenocysteine-specific elongation factor